MNDMTWHSLLLELIVWAKLQEIQNVYQVQLCCSWVVVWQAGGWHSIGPSIVSCVSGHYTDWQSGQIDTKYLVHEETEATPKWTLRARNK